MRNKTISASGHRWKMVRPPFAGNSPKREYVCCGMVVRRVGWLRGDVWEWLTPSTFWRDGIRGEAGSARKAMRSAFDTRADAETWASQYQSLMGSARAQGLLPTDGVVNG